MVNVVFLHPDLGIGGAERLVLDAAIALQNSDHSIHIITNHHNKSHSFKETKDGTFSVTVVGDWIPQSIFSKFHAFFAYLRMIYAAIYLVLFSDVKPDIIFCDLISACIPVLQLSKKPIIFYCHFPDQLLSQPGGNGLKIFYRTFINWLEEKTTGKADVILVNSNFTKSVFKNTFKSISKDPIVLYPSINTGGFFENPEIESRPDKVVFLSINRYERKKNIGLAVEALAILKQKLLDDEKWKIVELIIAGGFDERVLENKEYHKELLTLSQNLDVTDSVVFLKSPSDNIKVNLLKKCRCVIYTPANEHFGIVPLEAMYCKKPVIAINSGGPTETIENDKTGFLCPPEANIIADAMYKCYSDVNFAETLGIAARQRFDKLFSFESFSKMLNNIVENTVSTS